MRRRLSSAMITPPAPLSGDEVDRLLVSAAVTMVFDVAHHAREVSSSEADDRGGGHVQSRCLQRTRLRGRRRLDSERRSVQHDLCSDNRTDVVVGPRRSMSVDLGVRCSSIEHPSRRYNKVQRWSADAMEGSMNRNDISGRQESFGTLHEALKGRPCLRLESDAEPHGGYRDHGARAKTSVGMEPDRDNHPLKNTADAGSYPSDNTAGADRQEAGDSARMCKWNDTYQENRRQRCNVHNNGSVTRRNCLDLDTAGARTLRDFSRCQGREDDSRVLLRAPSRDLRDKRELIEKIRCEILRMEAEALVSLYGIWDAIERCSRDYRYCGELCCLAVRGTQCQIRQPSESSAGNVMKFGARGALIATVAKKHNCDL
jgi:hypothetical protein